jgi:hypothetical protein
MSAPLISATQQRRLANLKPWPKGKSGNPTGFSGIHGEVRRLATQASPEAITALVEIMRTSKDDRCRIVAAQAILDRAGMTPPKVKGDEQPERPGFNLDDLTIEQLQALRFVFGELAGKADARDDCDD